MLENYCTSPDVLRQVENAKKNIDAIIDYHLQKCGDNKEKFRNLFQEIGRVY